MRHRDGTTREKVMEKEACDFEKRLSTLNTAKGTTLPVIVISEDGKNLKTTDWAKLWQGLETRTAPQVAFLVGGAMGIAPRIRKAASFSLSFGAQTLSHELARIMLLEQIYRVTSFLKGHPYHHEG